VDIAKSEQVDHEIDAFVAKRDAQRRETEGDRPVEELWAASERAYFARLDEEQRRARLAYHEGQVARLGNTLGALVAYHEAEAEKYRDHDTKESAA
jgi:hypothetical protein